MKQRYKSRDFISTKFIVSLKSHFLNLLHYRYSHREAPSAILLNSASNFNVNCVPVQCVWICPVYLTFFILLCRYGIVSNFLGLISSVIFCKNSQEITTTFYLSR